MKSMIWPNLQFEDMLCLVLSLDLAGQVEAEKTGDLVPAIRVQLSPERLDLAAQLAAHPARCTGYDTR